MRIFTIILLLLLSLSINAQRYYSHRLQFDKDKQATEVITVIDMNYDHGKFKTVAIKSEKFTTLILVRQLVSKRQVDKYILETYSAKETRTGQEIMITVCTETGKDVSSFAITTLERLLIFYIEAPKKKLI